MSQTTICVSSASSVGLWPVHGHNIWRAALLPLHPCPRSGTKRNDIVKQLMDLNEVPVHSYGACMRNQDVSAACTAQHSTAQQGCSVAQERHLHSLTCHAQVRGQFTKGDVFKKYKFCIVMENTEGAKDYVTEKLWHGAAGAWGLGPCFFLMTGRRSPGVAHGHRHGGRLHAHLHGRPQHHTGAPDCCCPACGPVLPVLWPVLPSVPFPACVLTLPLPRVQDYAPLPDSIINYVSAGGCSRVLKP
jgi:hypothetical protein